MVEGMKITLVERSLLSFIFIEKFSLNKKLYTRNEGNYKY
jgi:hypothetical protein